MGSHEEVGKKPFYKKVWFWIVVVIIVSIIASISSNDEETVSDTNTSIDNSNNAVKVTDISDFNYSIEDDELTLERYTGDDDYIIIADSYEIEGTEYQVETIDLAIFNGCGDVSTVYFPKSIKLIYDYTLTYFSAEHVDIYYEGTKEEWEDIFTEYEASTVSEEWEDEDYEGAGEALAYKLNSYVGGSDYDESQFTYHYDSDIEDIQT